MPCFSASLRCCSIRPGPPPHELDREAAPELELAADVVGLPAPDRRELHALGMQPAHRVARAADQPVAQLAVGAVLRDAEHVVEELVAGVGAEIAARDLVRGEVRHDRGEVVDAVVDAAERAGGEARVAAHQLLGRALQHQHLGALLARGERRAERRIAGADHHHVPTIRHEILQTGIFVTPATVSLSRAATSFTMREGRRGGRRPAMTMSGVSSASRSCQSRGGWAPMEASLRGGRRPTKQSPPGMHVARRLLRFARNDSWEGRKTHET